MGWRSALAMAAVLLSGCATSGHVAEEPVVNHADDADLVLTPVAPLEVTAAATGRVRRPPGLYDLQLDVGAEVAKGLVAIPAGTPTTLVLVAHGWGGTAATHEDDLRALAHAGAVAAAMEFRGPSSAFKVQAGIDDTVAATLALQEEYPEVDRTMIYGWSMGGEVALLAPLAAPQGTYDYVFSGAGVMDLETFWHEAPFARPAIENETGGPPMEASSEYAARSPERHAASLVQQGVARVFLVHGAGDVLVPLEHAERMFTALGVAGQPVSYYVVTKDRTSLCVATQCVTPLPAGHEAGHFRLLQPFIQHRIDRLADPAEPAVRGTYDGETGQYDPSDVG